MISKNIDISVVVTCYNESKTIKQSLLSALEQDADCNFEVIVVDDKSKDDSASIIRELAIEYESLSFIQLNKNSGQSVSGNVACAAAKGKYIVRLDGDDIFMPGLIQTLWEKACDEKADIVVADYTRYDIKTGVSETMPVDPESVYGLVMCGNLFLKDAFMKTGGIKQILFEEYDMYLNMKSLPWKWVHSEAPLYKYIQYPVMQSNQSDYLLRGIKELAPYWDRKILARYGFEKLLEDAGL